MIDDVSISGSRSLRKAKHSSYKLCKVKHYVMVDIPVVQRILIQRIRVVCLIMKKNLFSSILAFEKGLLSGLLIASRFCVHSKTFQISALRLKMDADKHGKIFAFYWRNVFGFNNLRISPYLTLHFNAGVNRYLFL